MNELRERRESRPLRPELLAPAGDERALIAAVQAGADAVYLGLKRFGARRGARNFSPDELSEAVRYAHLRGCKVYLTLNVLILPEEVREALEAAEGAREAGVDAFIVQDLGLASLLRTQVGDVPLHGSTQMSTHTPDGLAALAAFGFSRATLARELSIAQIARLSSSSAIPVEVFVHGALCYCYSGQCLLSSMVGGRSGNRGLCVQACRLPYDLVEAGRPVDVGGAHPLSTRDLAAIDLIPGLVEAGVAAFKVEGRLKSHVYVSTVVDVYRRAIDRYLARPESYVVPEEDLEALEEVFSRGFTEAYLASVKDHRMMSPARPSDRGLALGRIAGCDNAGGCEIKLGRELAVGDEIEVWVRKGGRVKVRVSSMSVGGKKVSAAGAGETVRVPAPGSIREGDRVFRTTKASLVARANQLLRPAGERRTVPVKIRVEMAPGRPVLLEGEAGAAHARVEGAVVEAARGAGVEAGEVQERLARLGGTSYRAESVVVRTDAAVHLPFGRLTEAKQRLLGQLDEKRLAPWRRVRVIPEYESPPVTRRAPVHPALAVAVDELALARAIADEGVDWLYMDVSFERDRRRMERELPAVADAARAVGAGFAPALPAIARTSELEFADSLVEVLGDRLDAVVVGNLGQIERYRGRVPALIGDFPLNVTNQETALRLGDLGVARIGLSLELTGEQVREIISRVALPVEVLAFGALQVMVAEHCLYSMPDSCRRCAGRQGLVRDEKGFDFPVRSDCACRTRVYNPFDLSLLRQAADLSRSGVNTLRLNLNNYSAKAALEVVKGWKNVLTLLPDEEETAMELAAELDRRLSARRRFTTGHYFRPVL